MIHGGFFSITVLACTNHAGKSARSAEPPVGPSLMSDSDEATVFFHGGRGGILTGTSLFILFTGRAEREGLPSLSGEIDRRCPCYLPTVIEIASRLRLFKASPPLTGRRPPHFSKPIEDYRQRQPSISQKRTDHHRAGTHTYKNRPA
jgi:hypothetical protein